MRDFILRQMRYLYYFALTYRNQSSILMKYSLWFYSKNFSPKDKKGEWLLSNVDSYYWNIRMLPIFRYLHRKKVIK